MFILFSRLPQKNTHKTQKIFFSSCYFGFLFSILIWQIKRRFIKREKLVWPHFGSVSVSAHMPSMLQNIYLHVIYLLINKVFHFAAHLWLNLDDKAEMEKETQTHGGKWQQISMKCRCHYLLFSWLLLFFFTFTHPIIITRDVDIHLSIRSEKEMRTMAGSGEMGMLT